MIDKQDISEIERVTDLLATLDTPTPAHPILQQLMEHIQLLIYVVLGNQQGR
jgi:hypothetical protein